MASHRTKMTEGGRLVVPAELRRQLGLQPGTELVLDIADGELRVRSVQQAIDRAQALVRRYVPANVDLAGELIADRRETAPFE